MLNQPHQDWNNDKIISCCCNSRTPIENLQGLSSDTYKFDGKYATFTLHPWTTWHHQNTAKEGGYMYKIIRLLSKWDAAERIQLFNVHGTNGDWIMRAEWSPMRECWASGSNFTPWPLHGTQHIRSSPLTTGDNECKPWSKYRCTSSGFQPTTKLILLQQSNTNREFGLTHKILRIMQHPLCRSRNAHIIQNTAQERGPMYKVNANLMAPTAIKWGSSDLLCLKGQLSPWPFHWPAAHPTLSISKINEECEPWVNLCKTVTTTNFKTSSSLLQPYNLQSNTNRRLPTWLISRTLTR